MPTWPLPDTLASPAAGDPPSLPDANELRGLITDLRLERADPDAVTDQLAAAQATHAAPGGPLSSVAPAFRIPTATLREVLHTRAGDIDWHVWAGVHDGQVNGAADQQTWHPPRPLSPGITVQVADFSDATHGYNITYADGLHAGYDRKTDRISGVHVGYGRRIDEHDFIVWLLPDETFLEVIGPNGHDLRRTAISSNGSTWGHWRVHPGAGQGTAV